jgi:hypothetical protein
VTREPPGISHCPWPYGHRLTTLRITSIQSTRCFASGIVFKNLGFHRSRGFFVPQEVGTPGDALKKPNGKPFGGDSNTI